MSEPNPPLRHFPDEVEALAKLWSTSALTTDEWAPTGKKWPTDSRPFEVKNQNNIRGVAKPGAVIADRCLRAAHEKIVSDLAFDLGLPIPPVILWDRGEDCAEDRFTAISKLAFEKDLVWSLARASRSEAQMRQAARAAGAMQAFDTWIAASDRKNDHVLIEDSDDEDHLGIAYIDHAFSLSREWLGLAGPLAEPRIATPTDPGFVPDAGVTAEIALAIEQLEEARIAQIVKQIPTGWLPDEAAAAVLSGLLGRRSQLRVWLGIRGG